MGNADTKLHFRKSIVQLLAKTQPIDASDEGFWDQFWGEHVTSVQDIFTLIPSTEIRALREEAPSNLATLCYKAVEKLVNAADTGCSTPSEQLQVLNCIRILTRIIPYIFEDPEWRGFFWSNLPSQNTDSGVEESVPLAHSLIQALCDLLFCPDFTVTPSKKLGPDKHEDIQSIDSCEYIWEAGVGFAYSPPNVPAHNNNRTEILKLILTCSSQTIYQISNDCNSEPNPWIALFTSVDNRHALPLFTSLLNIVAAYKPTGMGVPYNHLLFADMQEPLVEVALQILITSLDYDSTSSPVDHEESPIPENLFVNYLSRIHREEDFSFVLRGFTRLLNNPLLQTYLPHSSKKVSFHQELLVFFWKFCDYNKKFLFYVLKSSEVLDILVPILYHLNDARADQSRVGLMHIGVFILLLLSGERNFGVRLNKLYASSIPMDIPVFTGTHSDLLIIVFHKIMTTGHHRLQPLFDCLLTILVNVSPYIKTMSMVASTKLLHLLEAFSMPWFLFSAPHHHHLIFFLLETFNNIIQYQFDGNSNLIYTIIRKRHVFYSLQNLSCDSGSINRSVNRRAPHRDLIQQTSESKTYSRMMEGSQPAQPAQPGTKTATLPKMPHIDKMTEKESAHPSTQQLSHITASSTTSDLVSAVSPTTSISSPPHFGDSTETNRDVGEGMRQASYSAREIQPPTEDNNVPELEDLKLTEDEGDFLRKKSPDPISTANLILSIHGSTSIGDTRESADSSSHVNIKESQLMKKAASLASKELSNRWIPSVQWAQGWKHKLPLQTVMRLLQVLVPQVEKICIDKGLTDESEILRFLHHGTLVGLLPVPHPILIRKYQANAGTATWFRTYMWGIIYLRNVDPPIWYDTDVKLFEIQRV